MPRTVVMIVGVLAIFSCDVLGHGARSDGITVPQLAKKVRHHYRASKCGLYDRCGVPVGCPDGTCYSLYGAYGPYGGPAYWARYTAEGWRHR
jgi:hypothetical protein